jgi:hypothetical protein
VKPPQCVDFILQPPQCEDFILQPQLKSVPVLVPARFPFNVRCRRTPHPRRPQDGAAGFSASMHGWRDTVARHYRRHRSAAHSSPSTCRLVAIVAIVAANAAPVDGGGRISQAAAGGSTSRQLCCTGIDNSSSRRLTRVRAPVAGTMRFGCATTVSTPRSGAGCARADAYIFGASGRRLVNRTGSTTCFESEWAWSRWRTLQCFCGVIMLCLSGRGRGRLCHFALC